MSDDIRTPEGRADTSAAGEASQASRAANERPSTPRTGLHGVAMSVLFFEEDADDVEESH